MQQVLATCSFDLSDQHGFAQLSGDLNPFGLDPGRARRTPSGEPVVPGIHLLLRTLDEWIGRHPPALERPIVLRRLRGRFPNPTFLDEPVEISLVSESAGHVKLDAMSQDACLLRLELQWDYQRHAVLWPAPASDPSDLACEPRSPSLAELKGMAGQLRLFGDLTALATDFPELARRLSARQLADLLACARLVGMECPGLHGMLCGFDLESCSEREQDSLAYRVAEVIPQTSFAQLEVRGGSLEGTLDTQRRPEPSPAPDFCELIAHVDLFEFEDQIALVVGGSRGIGAVTAKLIAAGGGWPIVTYQRGEDEALRLAREIRAGGGRCDVVQCDVGSPGPAVNWIDAQGIVPSHLYYFASPAMFAKRTGVGYCPELYQRFAAAYVDGFTALLLACHLRRPRGITAFFPSSLSLDRPSQRFEEYGDAKRAAELLCRDFDQADTPIRVRVARLPRMDTDQTVSPLRRPAALPMDVMLRELRSLVEESDARAR